MYGIENVNTQVWYGCIVDKLHAKTCGRVPFRLTALLLRMVSQNQVDINHANIRTPLTSLQSPTSYAKLVTVSRHSFIARELTMQ